MGPFCGSRRPSALDSSLLPCGYRPSNDKAKNTSGAAVGVFYTPLRQCRSFVEIACCFNCLENWRKTCVQQTVIWFGLVSRTGLSTDGFPGFMPYAAISLDTTELLVQTLLTLSILPFAAAPAHADDTPNLLPEPGVLGLAAIGAVAVLIARRGRK